MPRKACPRVSPPPPARAPAPAPVPPPAPAPVPVPDPAPAAAPAGPPRVRFLRLLGLHGWDGLDAPVLAALATESPLLLIGPHGSGKTMVLNRLAEALGLVHRHYNASLLSFDDLVGFPVPRDGRLEWLQTPSTIHGAESVLFDEVSRCRPEVQNKLFPLVHERVLMGVALPRLVHRWAAMNPPPAEGTDEGYAGAEPLDVALADRFAFVLTVPALADLGAEDRRRVLRPGAFRARTAGRAVRRLVAAARRHARRLDRAAGDAAAEYVSLLADRLGEAGHPLSTRRAQQLVRNVVSVRGAAAALGGADDPEGDALTALRSSLPDAAWGQPVPPNAVLAAHRIAWNAAALPPDSARRRLLTATRPEQRIALALVDGIPRDEATLALADAYASLSLPSRLVTAAILMPVLSRRTDLPAIALEAVATDWARLAADDRPYVFVYASDGWKRTILSTYLPRLADDSPRSLALSAVAVALVREGTRFDVAELEAAWDRTRAALGGSLP